MSNTKRARKSTCNHCSSVIIEKTLINAVDCDTHQNNYGYEDDELSSVDWVAIEDEVN